MLSTFRLLQVAVFTGCVSIIGCSSGNPNAPASVSGKVTYKGTTVTAGTISFYTTESGVYTTGINADGSYEAVDIPVGPVEISIETESANPDKKTPVYGGGASGGPNMGGMGSPNPNAGSSSNAPPKSKLPGLGPKPDGAGSQSGGGYVKIPAKYSDRSKSGLQNEPKVSYPIYQVNSLAWFYYSLGRPASRLTPFRCL
jgi:hypothetical protein